ncbi:excinuclease ABC subunit UvrB [Candidatus Uhrbacteria bacterium]|nr:excinuclease ABC subunit UvrB [Candidatus Uhrbacteria bacterium]
MGDFKLHLPYKPSGDQPEAISSLIEGLNAGEKHQTLLGATGTGKTFTVANVIQEIKKPTLVIAHNKTLAAQLCNEFREFFPDNAVEYFVSYYDYYQPEAYIPKSDTYIEKEAMINEEIDRLRHHATQALLTRSDVIICASVSCIYGLGAPEAYEKTVLHLSVGDLLTRTDVLARLVEMQFTRTTSDLTRGCFRILGGVLELMPADEETLYRVEAPRGTVETIRNIDPVTRKDVREQQELWVFPAKHFITLGPDRDRAIAAIREELRERLAWFEKQGKLLEAERLERRTHFDLEMIENLGYCNGIENYSRHLSGRAAGEPPDTLFSYFPKDFLLVIDESHVTLPQIRGMYEGDRARKDTLIEHGFRLPSARDNRPMTFREFEGRVNQAVFVSATPGPYEAAHADRVVEQIIRPTGLVDPEVVIRPITPQKGIDAAPSQVEDVIGRIKETVKRGDRALVTTLTKKMAEDLNGYLAEQGIKTRYLHSDINTVERLEILSEFRKGTFDVVVGVNLLREGLDLPEVALVAILDADKEGFLRSDVSLIQIIGRAARNIRGRVVLYADRLTGSIGRAVQETNRRREKQLKYNAEHGITPQSIVKAVRDTREVLGLSVSPKDVSEILKLELKAETDDLRAVLKKKEKEMKQAALDLEFELAAILRDEMSEILKEIKRREKETGPKKEKRLRHGRTR